MTEAAPPPAEPSAWNADLRLPAGRLFPLLFRSFFLQASWSFERMQSVGWTAALSGEGRRVAGGEKAAAFLQRHLGYFNTNPAMASYLLGGVVRLEEEVAQGRATEDDVSRLKRGLTGALAAWGDTFFWASLRPFSTATGTLVAMISGAWGVAAYLLAYNAFHLYYRVRGISEGYRWGSKVTARLTRTVARTRAGTVRRLGLAGAGALATLSLSPTLRALGPAGLSIVLGLSAVAGVLLVRRASLGTWWGLLAVGGGLVYALATGGR